MGKFKDNWNINLQLTYGLAHLTMKMKCVGIKCWCFDLNVYCYQENKLLVN